MLFIVSSPIFFRQELSHIPGKRQPLPDDPVTLFTAFTGYGCSIRCHFIQDSCRGGKPLRSEYLLQYVKHIVVSSRLPQAQGRFWCRSWALESLYYDSRSARARNLSSAIIGAPDLFTSPPR